MKVLKFISKVLLFILSIIFSIILIVDIVAYNTRDITSKFISEEQIKKCISNINILDLFKDENGNELEEITKVKQELINVGLPVETVEAFINSEPVKQATTDVTMLVVDYIFYNKQIETFKIEKEQILTFVEQNMNVIVSEMQEHNIPNSDLITDEKQEKILSVIEENLPIIEENINKITATLEETIKGTDEYQEVIEYQNKVEEILNIIRYIYSDAITTILLVIAIVCIIGIIICRLSPYCYLKWLGIISLLSGSILYLFNIGIDKLNMFANEIPYMFKNLYFMFINDSKQLFINNSIPYFIISTILITLNIIIYYILDRREDKKFDL